MLHKALRIGDLEWLVMPAILTRQFYLFRDGDQPVGVAVWASLDAKAARKLDKTLLETENRLTLADWTSGTNIWLIDLVAPFANLENRQRDIMMADLISGPLKGKAFGVHITDPETGHRRAQHIEANAGDDLKVSILAALGADAGLKDESRH